MKLLSGSCLAALVLVSACAGLSGSNELVLGSDICNGEASQAYFPSYSETLDVTAAQIVNSTVDSLKGCPNKKITLVSVTGNDGAAAPALLQKRADLVRDLLVSRGIATSRITSEISGSLVKKVAPAPIGRVYIITR